MEREEAYYGSVEFSHFLPTMAALRYLNCCRTAGWHKCNKYYHLKYEQGVPIVFLLYTVKGTGQLVAEVPDIKEAEATNGGTAARTDGVIRTKRKRWVLTEGTLCVVPADRFLEYGTWGSGDDDFWEFYWLNLDGDYVRRTAEKLWQDGHVVHACRNTEYFRKIFHGLLHVTFPEKNREMEHSGIIQDLLQKLLAEMVFERKGLGVGRRNGILEKKNGRRIGKWTHPGGVYSRYVGNRSHEFCRGGGVDTGVYSGKLCPEDFSGRIQQAVFLVKKSDYPHFQEAHRIRALRVYQALPVVEGL